MRESIVPSFVLEGKLFPDIERINVVYHFSVSVLFLLLV